MSHLLPAPRKCPRQAGWAAERTDRLRASGRGAIVLVGGRQDIKTIKIQSGCALAALCQTGLTPTPTAEGRNQNVGAPAPSAYPLNAKDCARDQRPKGRDA